MKIYDYDGIKNFIEKNRENIVSVEAGMYEDWFCTAMAIFENDHFLINLEEKPEIAGINGSQWATPTISVEFKDGSKKMIAAFVGKSSGEKNPFFSLGCLSGPCQDAIAEITETLEEAQSC